MLDDAQLRTLEERLRYLRELEERRAAILESIREPGQARRRARGADPGRRHQGAAGGHLPARTSPSGAPRRRSPARPASSRSPTGCSPTRRWTRTRPPRPSSTPDKGVADAGRRAGGRAGDPGRALRRGRRPDRRAARADVDARPARRRRCGRARRRRARSSPTTSTSPSRSPSCPRTGSWRCSAARRRRSSTSPWSPRSRRSRADGPHRSYEAADRRAGSASPTRAGPADKWLLDTVRWAWRTRILVHLGIDLRMRLRQAAEDEAVRVFAANLRDLLLAAPAGTRATMGLDPGLPHRREGRRRRRAPARSSPPTRSTRTCRSDKWDESLATLAAAGQGARRRADRDRQRHRLPRDRQARRRAHRAAPGAEAHQGDGLRGGRLGVLGVRVRLAGAARPGRVAARRGLHRPPAAGPARRAGEDRPEVDRRRPVPARPVRGEAVALARRGRRGLRQRRRRRRQHRVRAAAVPGVRASAPASPRTSWRTATPTARSAPGEALKDVPRLGPKAFEQCAGFLRIRGGDDPLDASSVHPEAYPVVRRILADDRRRRRGADRQRAGAARR